MRSPAGARLISRENEPRLRILHLVREPIFPSEEEAGIRALGRMLARHNWHVAFLAISTLFVAAAGWTFVYAGIYWMLLLAVTVARGAEATAPPAFLSRFVSVGIIACALVWLTRRRGIIAPPRDSKSPFEVFLDIALALPRTTLAMWETLFAFQFVNEHQRSLAWQLLKRLQQNPALPAHSLPQELPELSERRKVLLALQLIGLVEFQWRGGNLMVVLREDSAREIFQRKVRIRLRR